MLWDDLSEKKVELGFVFNVSLLGGLGGGFRVAWVEFAVRFSILFFYRKVVCIAILFSSWRR